MSQKVLTDPELARKLKERHPLQKFAGQRGCGERPGRAALTPPASPPRLAPAAPRRDGGRGQQHPLPAQRPQRPHQRLGHPRGRRVPGLLERPALASPGGGGEGRCSAHRAPPHARTTPPPQHPAPPNARPRLHARGPFTLPAAPATLPSRLRIWSRSPSAPALPGNPLSPPPNCVLRCAGWICLNKWRPFSWIQCVPWFWRGSREAGEGKSGMGGTHFTFHEVRGQILEPAGLHRRPWLVAEGQRLVYTEEILVVRAPPPRGQRPGAGGQPTATFPP